MSLTQIAESPILYITTHLLNGQNFLRWSQSMKLFIRGRGKISYLNGTKQAPNYDDPTYHVWDAYNSMILAWLVNSMEPEISQTYMHLSTAKQLLDVVNDTYSDLGNSSQVYELKTKIRNTTQGNMSVTSYYNMLKSLWQELDLFYDLEWSCAEDSAQYQRTVEKDRVMEFLAGLNTDLDEVRGRVLGKESLPISKAFSEVRREESRRGVMMGKRLTNSENLLNATAPANKTVAAAYNQRPTAQILNNPDEKPKVWCDYCNKPRHTREKCGKLNGKPANWKERKPGEKNGSRMQATAETEIPFSKEQLKHLYKMINQVRLSSVPSGSLAQTGSAFTSSLNSAPWIIDSSASDHMTNQSHFFTTYSPCSGHFKNLNCRW